MSATLLVLASVFSQTTEVQGPELIDNIIVAMRGETITITLAPSRDFHAQKAAEPEVAEELVEMICPGSKGIEIQQIHDTVAITATRKKDVEPAFLVYSGGFDNLHYFGHYWSNKRDKNNEVAGKYVEWLNKHFNARLNDRFKTFEQEKDRRYKSAAYITSFDVYRVPPTKK